MKTWEVRPGGTLTHWLGNTHFSKWLREYGILMSGRHLLGFWYLHLCEPQQTPEPCGGPGILTNKMEIGTWIWLFLVFNWRVSAAPSVLFPPPIGINMFGKPWGFCSWLVDGCLLPSPSSHGLHSICICLLIASSYKDTSPIALEPTLMNSPDLLL